MAPTLPDNGCEHPSRTASPVDLIVSGCAQLSARSSLDCGTSATCHPLAIVLSVCLRTVISASKTIVPTGPQSQTGIRNAIKRFDAVPESSHHRVRWWLADGGPMSDALNRALVPFEVLSVAAFILFVPGAVGSHVRPSVGPFRAQVSKLYQTFPTCPT